MIVFFRAVVPTLLIGSLCRLRHQPLHLGGDRWMYLASFINALRQLLYVVAFTLTSISNSVLILYTSPLFAAVLSALWLKESLSGRKLLGLLFGFSGAFIVYFGDGLPAYQDSVGMGAMLISSILNAIMLVIFKKEIGRYSGLQTIFFQNVVGAVCFAFLAFYLYSLPVVEDVVLGVSYGLLVGFVGFIPFYAALKRLSVATVGTLAYLEVIFAILYAALLFGEELSIRVICGGSLIIGGALVARYTRESSVSHKNYSAR